MFPFPKQRKIRNATFANGTQTTAATTTTTIAVTDIPVPVFPMRTMMSSDAATFPSCMETAMVGLAATILSQLQR